MLFEPGKVPMSLQWTEATVVGRRVWDDGLFTLTIEAPGVEPFVTGQFLQLALQLGDELIHRPYSVASPFGARLEFFVVVVPGGALTPKLWQLEPGDRVLVGNHAAGRFTLEHCPEAEELWLVGTGTGLAPYVAMLRTEEPWSRHRRVVLVHGVRNGGDLAYRDELTELAARRPDEFAYVPTTSRDATAGTLVGRIPVLLESGELEAAAGSQLSPEQSAVMLCGNPAMLDDMERVLESKGLKRHRSKSPGQIVVERYW